MLTRKCLICGEATSKGRCPDCGAPTEVVMPDNSKGDSGSTQEERAE